MVMFTVAVLSTILLTAQAGGHGQGGQQGEPGSRMARSGWGAQQGSGWQGQDQGKFQGRMQSQGADQGWAQERNQQGGWQQGAGGKQGGSEGGRYRTNILDDDDVYGYEANYPNGEALFVNYRNSDARARRGPDFARSNSISARNRMGQMGEQGSQGGYRQRGAMMAAGGNQPMW